MKTEIVITQLLTIFVRNISMAGTSSRLLSKKMNSPPVVELKNSS